MRTQRGKKAAVHMVRQIKFLCRLTHNSRQPPVVYMAYLRKEMMLYLRLRPPHKKLASRLVGAKFAVVFN